MSKIAPIIRGGTGPLAPKLKISLFLCCQVPHVFCCFQYLVFQQIQAISLPHQSQHLPNHLLPDQWHALYNGSLVNRLGDRTEHTIMHALPEVILQLVLARVEPYHFPYKSCCSNTITIMISSQGHPSPQYSA